MSPLVSMVAFRNGAESMKRFLVLAGFVFLAPVGLEAQLEKPAPRTVVLKAARLFDGKSDALVKPGLVVVTDGKIAGVGPNAAIPPGAEVIDLGDEIGRAHV